MARDAAAEEGFDHVIAFDMGGTTAKLGAVDEGVPSISPTFEIDPVRYRRGSGLPINTPAVELLEIGAGGGSIARAELGTIAVGPESAGAKPGPVCYGLGGDVPTVTDANLVLGYLDPEYFNDGAFTLDIAAARSSIQSKIAKPLDLSTEDAAWGIHLIATNNMEHAIRSFPSSAGEIHDAMQWLPSAAQDLYMPRDWRERSASHKSSFQRTRASGPPSAYSAPMLALMLPQRAYLD